MKFRFPEFLTPPKKHVNIYGKGPGKRYECRFALLPKKMASHLGGRPVWVILEYYNVLQEQQMQCDESGTMRIVWKDIHAVTRP